HVGTLAFDSAVQNQRGALALLNKTVYVPYGGHYGDCGDFHGWVVGVPLANPAAPIAWATRARGGGSWAPSGIASDGTSLYVATGNTVGASEWSDGEAILRLPPSLVPIGLPADYFTPANWLQLDDADIDIGGTGPVLFRAAASIPANLTI